VAQHAVVPPHSQAAGGELALGSASNPATGTRRKVYLATAARGGWHRTYALDAQTGAPCGRSNRAGSGRDRRHRGGLMEPARDRLRRNGLMRIGKHVPVPTRSAVTSPIRRLYTTHVALDAKSGH